MKLLKKEDKYSYERVQEEHVDNAYFRYSAIKSAYDYAMKEIDRIQKDYEEQMKAMHMDPLHSESIVHLEIAKQILQKAFGEAVE